ncbi:hypothetical protein AKJ09_05062 [Labilithrix luteola]|uniref:Uncharacterized protein n=1 Tax=Labilithrix luteola TaxID=1391654 RepID=A0A0K1PXZ0_9BACT|nr:hypothetical protein [Labilithrix luteola]AKU98398.1 hypothetical protein AKJ09_05062 [Labilithrix luteola]
MYRFGSLLSIALLSVTLPSCTAALDLERFHQSERTASASMAQFYDVRFSARSMTSHLGEYFEIRVVDRADRVQAKAVCTHLAQPDFSLYMKGVVPKTNPPYRLDFWADHNNSGKYDGIEGGINEKDHAWRRVLADPLPEDVRFIDNRYEVNFLHDTAFVDIFTDLTGKKISGEDTLLPFNLNIVGATAYVGKVIEVRVVEKESGRLVGLHRQGSAVDTYPAQILGILDEQTPYEVSTYVDANGDGKFSAGDPSWKVDLVSTSNGIASDFDLKSLPQTPIETGDP